MRHQHPHYPQAARGDPSRASGGRIPKSKVGAALFAAVFILTALPSAVSAADDGPSALSTTGTNIQDPIAVPEGERHSMGPWPGSSCQFEARAHRVHPSTIRGTSYASVHAYWNHLDGDCPARAVVTANLQAKLCTDELGNNCWYQTMWSESRRVRPGGGTNHETVAKYACASTNRAHWSVYVVVKVEIDNWLDKYATYTSTPVAIPCRIY